MRIALVAMLVLVLPACGSKTEEAATTKHRDRRGGAHRWRR